MDGNPNRDGGAEDLRLIAHVRLETGSGEKIAEIEIDDLMRFIFGDTEPGEAERLIRKALATRLESPIRGLVRGHLLRLRESQACRRLDRPGKDLVWLDDPEDDLLGEKAVAFHRDRALEDAA